MVAPAGWSLSYADLDRRSDEVAAGLASLGVGVGTVAAVVLPVIPEYLVLYAALAKLGAVTAGVNHRLTAPERAVVLDRADPDLVLATAELAPPDRTVVEVVPARHPDELLAGVRVDGEAPPPLVEDPTRPVAIVFTSGTTGTPKGAVFGGRQLEAIAAIDVGGRWGDPEVPAAHSLLATSPTHLGPMTKLPGNLMRGGTMHLVERWTAGGALDATLRWRMPVIAGIPTQLALLLRDPRLDDLDLACVQGVVIGGGPATPSLIREARDRLGAPVAVRYACTEAGIGVGTAFTDPPEDAEASVGRPHPGVELTIRSEDGMPLPTGEVGEVALRSPAVMSGYHRDPDGTAAAFWPDGSVRTGDLGFVDEQGRLHLVGRSKEMFVRGGYNVYPMEVEAVLAEHPAVAEVAVVPRPDDVMGEVGVAFVVAVGDRTPTLDELRSFAAARLAHHKLPEDLRIVPALPLGPMEKVDRRALRELLSSTGARGVGGAGR